MELKNIKIIELDTNEVIEAIQDTVLYQMDKYVNQTTYDPKDLEDAIAFLMKGIMICSINETIRYLASDLSHATQTESDKQNELN